MESEIGEVVSSEIMPEAQRIYKRGMSQDEFMNEMFRGMRVTELRGGGIEVRDAPKWVHDLVDIIWDIFTKR